ncbi:MAG: adenylate/guanylate cyclase domain-containing protein [Alphaproteobacteria bacterium]|nr:adenylate/guanylate cyclase domain-containing protein [Alphaproteobacteria bacterium]
MTVAMNWTRKSVPAEVARLLTEAETSAERIVALVRCGLGGAAGALFLAVIVPATTPDSLVARHLPYILAFSIGYLAVGIASFVLAQPGRFRGWMTWLFTTLDLCFWAGLTISVVVKMKVPTNYFIATPPVVVTFLILALVSLRTNPLLQTYALCFTVAVFVCLFVWVQNSGFEEAQPPAAVMELLQRPQNFMRLSMLLVMGLTLVCVTFRTRRLVDRAIVETTQRNALTRYLPPQLADRMAQIDDRRLREGALQQAAVLFVDIRGFTTLAEGVTPAALSSLLGEFRSIVEAEVHAHNGIVDKFVGDSVMAVFGAPEAGADPAADAVACAVAISGAVDRWNDARRRQKLEPVVIGVGAHWGEVFCGAVGHGARLEFTVLGDTVNIASRLEEATKEARCRVVVSKALLDAARAQPGAEAGWIPLRDLQIRGRSGRMQVFART